MTRAARWVVPVAVTSLIGAGVAVTSAAQAASPDLPPVTASALLAKVGTTDVQALSGTVRTHARLGLPSIPDLGQGTPTGSDPQAVLTRLLSGENELRVWADGAGSQRVALVDDFAELDVVHSGQDVWTYSSSDNAATHYALPAEGSHGEDASALPEDAATATPAAMADQAIAAADPTTEISVGESTSVAGRDAYTLIITPRSGGTLVDHISIAVDAATGLPLDVAVYADGQDAAAFETGFTSVDLSAPDASVFQYSPPAGVTVTEGSVPSAPELTGGMVPQAVAGEKPTIHGTGWATVAEFAPGDTASAAGAPGQDTTGLLDQLTMPVAGGRAVSTALVNVLLTDDGRVLIGSVPVETLVGYAG